MKDLVKVYENTKLHNDILEAINENKGAIEISGLNLVVDSNIITFLKSGLKRQMVYILPNEIKAKQLYDKLKDDKKVVFIPKKEIILYDYIAESKNLSYERIDALNRLADKKDCLVIVSVEALMQKMVPKNALLQNVLDLKVKSVIDLEVLKEKLVKNGYVRTDLIEGRGQFSVRGDIIDIGTDLTTGIRIEFWGDEIDTIREFDIISQRSIKNIENVKIFPTHEYILEKPIDETVKEISQRYNRLNIENAKIEQIVENDISQILGNNYISKMDKYYDEFYNKPGFLLEYLDKNSIFILDEPLKIRNRVETINADLENTKKALIEKSKIVSEQLEYIDKNLLENNVIAHQKIYFQRDDNSQKDVYKKFKLNIKTRDFRKDQLPDFISYIKKSLGKLNIYVVVDKNLKNQFIKILEDNDIMYTNQEKFIQTQNSKSYVTVLTGNLEDGFEDVDTKNAFLNGNIFLTNVVNRSKRQKQLFKESQKVVYADLKTGDVVVHENHGIGIFIGVNRICLNNITKDYIKLKYRDNDILYVPTSQMDRVRKYVGADSSNVRLSSLSSKEWQKTKTRVKNNLRAIAKDLLEVYARRERCKGFAFSKDTVWQKEFEDKFEYVETDDQLRCIEEVKLDMEKSKPMDRLLCGDVGFGKTEVAIRAAFKAVQDSKQVVYVAPTTVLSNQQYKEFCERFKDYPVKVELLNRYKKPKEQKEILKRLKIGEVDIVLGTHRLFSKDVEFKDLGLLIIDEEQRFGVKHKEKIKKLKENIDVLTMSATPIPRTLHMSIAGIRDLSVIYTPPQDRKPIQTYVMEYDKDVIKEAMTHELERQGQVIYLFNSVEHMESKLSELEKMMPEAKIDFANGKMPGHIIEEKMEKFVDRQTDILLCTTILEAGIDIPNANTLIIENADKMGLSQLYQIRGRVGRSSRQAYAFITYKKEKIITEEADKRLKALKEFTEFGSGFKIAMRDLEIRGAGSLVGEIQSGHLEEVGYDTYMRLLEQVLEEEKTKKQIDDEYDVNIDVDISAYIPDTYITDENQKIDIYQKIAQCKNDEDISNILDELIDRFGEVPQEVSNLTEIARIRYLALDMNVKKLVARNGFLILTFKNDCFNFDLNYLQDRYKNKIRFGNTKEPKITISLNSTRGQQMLKDVTEELKELDKNYAKELITV